jgi:hypothetical protein
LVPESSFSVDIDTNKIVVTNTSLNADKWEWSFGDDSTSVEFEPVHFYKYPGDYNITLIVYNDCFSDTLVVPISLEFTKTNDLLVGGNIYIYPNPVKNSFVVKLNNISSEYRINVFDAYGKKINMFRSDANILMKRISLKGLPSGVYFVQVVAKSRSKIIKIFKE